MPRTIRATYFASALTGPDCRPVARASATVAAVDGGARTAPMMRSVCGSVRWMQPAQSSAPASAAKATACAAADAGALETKLLGHAASAVLPTGGAGACPREEAEAWEPPMHWFAAEVPCGYGCHCTFAGAAAAATAGSMDIVRRDRGGSCEAGAALRA